VDATTLFQTARQARQVQDIEVAVEAIDAAQKAAPDDPNIAAVRALLHYESWRPASDLFARAAALNPEDMELRRNQALGLQSEGDGPAAMALLERELRAQPFWTEGHRTLARIRLTRAEAGEHDRSFAEACATSGAPLALHLAWFHNAAIAKEWVKVHAILENAERAFPGQPALRAARFYCAAETGDDVSAEAALPGLASMNDPGLDLCRVRFHLRLGQWTEAERCARRHVGSASGAMFWPYLSLIWRLTDNPLAQWLDGAPPFLSVIDLDISSGQLGDLADVLRRLHILQAPYPEQSVRGGTQTDRPLFFHPDPAVQAARHKIMDAVRGYVDTLPPHDPHHPLLAPDRSTLLLDGSWSVRLTDKGFHASHSHVNGWISSAFYVALPDQPGPPPSGHFALGTPPPELGLELSAYQTVEPRPGRLVLFPSTMWHSTIPFDAGERLTIAFDIQRP
jgi:Putative 2OG-Fe(II) oxygenase